MNCDPHGCYIYAIMYALGGVERYFSIWCNSYDDAYTSLREDPNFLQSLHIGSHMKMHAKVSVDDYIRLIGTIVDMSDPIIQVD
jgi:hypothetical protein